ncbi:MAG TPA: putative toxin-antitoxin system toxin component, PIN family [Nitrospirota bacterium]|nr:putative toxin-antitoxin system toxin component, PIN family [Nitrospirota bacterium]
MIHVVLDTNQIISAILSPEGLADNILKFSGLKGEQKYQIVLSEPILGEIGRVLKYERLRPLHGWSDEKICDFLNLLKEGAIITAGKVIVEVVKSDPEDNKFFAAALEGRASYIVSRDIHLHEVKEYQGIKVLTPEVFITALRMGAI